MVVYFFSEYWALTVALFGELGIWCFCAQFGLRILMVVNPFFSLFGFDRCFKA